MDWQWPSVDSLKASGRTLLSHLITLRRLQKPANSGIWGKSTQKAELDKHICVLILNFGFLIPLHLLSSPSFIALCLFLCFSSIASPLLTPLDRLTPPPKHSDPLCDGKTPVRCRSPRHKWVKSEFSRNRDGKVVLFASHQKGRTVSRSMKESDKL